jgi:two-component system alkaline phosphatase synthesis response regulator PhoP
MRRLLIADDEEEVYRLYKKMLKGRYGVIWARDGQEAVDKYKELNPDLLLIDIMMPGKSGNTIPMGG